MEKHITFANANSHSIRTELCCSLPYLPRSWLDRTTGWSRAVKRLGVGRRREAQDYSVIPLESSL